MFVFFSICLSRFWFTRMFNSKVRIIVRCSLAEKSTYYSSDVGKQSASEWINIAVLWSDLKSWICSRVIAQHTADYSRAGVGGQQPISVWLEVSVLWWVWSVRVVPQSAIWNWVFGGVVNKSISVSQKSSALWCSWSAWFVPQSINEY